MRPSRWPTATAAAWGLPGQTRPSRDAVAPAGGRWNMFVPETSSRLGVSVRLGDSNWSVRPAVRSGVEYSDNGDFSHTIEASLTFGRRYGARFIVDRWAAPSGASLVLLQIGGYVLSLAARSGTDGLVPPFAIRRRGRSPGGTIGATAPSRSGAPHRPIDKGCTNRRSQHERLGSASNGPGPLPACERWHAHAAHCGHDAPRDAAGWRRA